MGRNLALQLACFFFKIERMDDKPGLYGPSPGKSYTQEVYFKSLSSFVFLSYVMSVMSPECAFSALGTSKLLIHVNSVLSYVNLGKSETYQTGPKKNLTWVVSFR